MSKPPQFNRPSGTLPQRASINDLLADGLRLHQSGKGPDAARLYEQVLAREPEQPAANHLLGLVRLQQGRPDEAVRLIQRATKANKTDAQYFANLGVALNAAGRPAEAVEALDRAIALKPAFPAAHSNRGMALKALGRLDEAAASYREAIALQPAEAGFHFNLANALNGAGDMAAAEAEFSFVSGMFRSVPESMLAGGYRDEAPIFVVGLPRSGKSTIEAILARHPDVHAGGELRLLSQLVDRSGLGQVVNAADIAPQRLVELGADYARHIRELAPGGKRVTDTMPPNFRLIGLIRAEYFMLISFQSVD